MSTLMSMQSALTWGTFRLRFTCWILYKSPPRNIRGQNAVQYTIPTNWNNVSHITYTISSEGFETTLKSRTALQNLSWNLEIFAEEIWNLENQPKCLYFLVCFCLRFHHACELHVHVHSTWAKPSLPVLNYLKQSVCWKLHSYSYTFLARDPQFDFMLWSHSTDGIAIKMP